MNKKEFFAAVNLYKRQPEIVQWKNDFLPKAIAASAKEILAHSTGNDEDAMAFANELASYTKKLDWLPDSEFAKISSLIEHSAEEMAEKYGATFDDGVLEHGTKWKDHKYIRIENGRYIYPEDVKKSTYKKIQTSKEEAQKKMDYIEGHQYVIPIKKGQTSVLTGEVATKEDEDNAPKTGLANLDLGKRVIEKTHDMTLAGNNQGQPTSLYVKNKYYSDGVTKTANELQKQINKADLDKKNLDELHSNMESLAKQNEIRKEKLFKAEAAAEVRKGDTSAQKAQAEGEAMQAWKNAKEATKRMEEDKARTIDRVADLESGLAKEEFDGELRIRKQALADANVDQKSIDDAKARKAEAIRAKDDNAKNQAQSEGEAYQKWKIKQDAKKGEGESYEKAQREGEAMDKYNREKKIPYTEAWWNEEEKRLKAISAKQDRNFVTITNETANGSKDGDANNSKSDFANKYSGVQSYKKSQNYGNYVKLGKENGLNENEVDQIIEAAQYAFEWRYNGAINGAKKQAEKWYKDAEIRPTKNRSGSIDIDIYQNGRKIATDITIDSLEQDIESQLKRGKKSPYVQHSFDLSTKEGYYAAIEEYKRKKV